MGKDVNIKVKTEGVDQAAGQIGKVAESVESLTRAQRESFEASQLAEEKATGVTDALSRMGDASTDAAQDQKDFQEYLAQTAESAQAAGDAVQDGGQEAADGMDNASKKAGFLDSVLGKVRNQALGMITGFLGIGGVIKLIEHLNKQLDEMIEKQKKLVEKSLSTAELGQTMEAATGTTGKQDQWTKEVLDLQKSGGMQSPDQAVELMLKANEYFKNQGGVKNPEIMAMLHRMAPKLGASGKSTSDIDAIFEAATKEGVAPAYMEKYLSDKIGISDAQARAYMDTPLAKSRSSQADQATRDKAVVTDTLADWKLRRQEADAERERQESVGENPRGIGNFAEMKRIAFDKLAQDLEAAKKNAPDGEKAEYDEYIRRVREEFPMNLELGKDRDNPRSQQHSLKRALEMAEGADPNSVPQSRPLTMVYDYSTHFHPRTGPDPFRERFSVNDA